VTLLDRIVAHKRVEVAAAQTRESLSQLRARAQRAAPTRSLRQALQRESGDPIRVLAEVKRASPSAGPIRPDADPSDIARAYAAGGAAAISVLTDRNFFAGELAFISQVKAAVGLPVLRKDFLVCEYQVVEARAAGADAILLIAAILDDRELRTMIDLAHHLGLEVLLEVHDAKEAQRAAQLPADVFGVNHRDLATLGIDMGLSRALLPLLPAQAVVIAESGIASRRDVASLEEAGVHAILVGETLMRAADPGARLRELLARP
jgi:indole-3-glycerol phosphate synthase